VISLSLLFSVKRTNIGFGLPLISVQEKLWAFLLENVTGARGLWNSLPPVYRQCAVCYTDFWEAYHEIFPQKRHRPVSKKSGQTNRIERFNCTMRQRISRLVRKSLSFSKKVANHIGAIWYFIHHYNANLAPVQ
jgi:insertion element IS1 protein InsB